MSISSYTTVTMLDSRPTPITITVPKSTDIYNRIITFKDLYGSASNSTITLVTRSGDTFEDGTFSTIMSNAYQTVNLYAGQPGKWLNVGATGSGESSAGLTTVSNLLNAVSTNVTTISTNLDTVSNTVASGRFPAISTNTISTNIVTGSVVGRLPANTLAASVSPLAVGNGNAYLSFSPQIEFQYNSGGYKHFMGSRHQGDTANSFGNAVDFWLYSATTGGSNASTTPGTCNVNTMSVTAAGVGIFNNSPSVALDVAGAGSFTAVSTNTVSTSQLNSSNISNVTNQYFQYGGNISGSIGGTGGQQGFLNISYPAAGTGHTNDGVTYIWGGNANGNRYINLDSTNIGITVPKGYGNIWLDANTINVGTFDMYSNIICNVSNLNFITGGSISNVNATTTVSLSTQTISTSSINTSSINGSDLDLTATSINMHTSSIQQYLNFVPVAQPVIQFGSWSAGAADTNGTGGPYTVPITDYNNTTYCIYVTGKYTTISPVYTAVPVDGSNFNVYFANGDPNGSNIFYWQTMGYYGASAGPGQGSGGGGGGPT